MRFVFISFVSCLLVFSLSPNSKAHESAWDFVDKERPHTDHSVLMQKPFKDGPSVTRACLKCHEKSAEEVMRTSHWTWLGKETKVPGHETPMRIGKKNLINNFCLGIQGNWAGCTRCHAGYGWQDETFDFSNEENVDCLVCHDQSRQYVKGTAGVPVEGIDLLAAAQSVALPNNFSCGICHFNGGGGDAVKHGDIDQSLIFPTPRIDVHMGKHNLTCIDCHKTKKHNIPGRSISVSVDTENRVYCTDCHQHRPHSDDRLNSHTNAVACQTCHIPQYAVDAPTKMSWDWSTAGQDLNIDDEHKYLKIKGSFTYQQNVQPHYLWFNGRSDRYILGDIIDPTQETVINRPHGSVHDSESQIWPFKVHRGKQIYDKQYRHLLQPKTVGKGGYWTDFDWQQAIRLGAEKTGVAYSGEYGFTSTTMYWKISHMVAERDRSLQCVDCHGNNGRMNWEDLGYEGDPLTLGDRKRMGLLSNLKARRID